jgi:environmental stress-induced protein Ves
MILINVIPKENYLQVRWKNGQGMTFEIARDNTTINEDFSWRLSMADVAHSGPFSIFPNTDRIIILLEGMPIKLTHLDTNKQHNLDLLVPYQFDGNWNTKAEIGGPGKDLNIMFKKHLITAEAFLKSLSFDKEESISINEEEKFLFCVSGTLFLKDQINACQYQINKYDTVRISNDNENCYSPPLKLHSPDHSLYLMINLTKKSDK